MKQAVVFLRDRKAGVLTEDENGYTFQLQPRLKKKRHCPKMTLHPHLGKRDTHQKSHNPN